MNTLTDLQASYLAGFLDSDGSIIAQIVPRKDYRFKYQIRVSVLFIQKRSRQHLLQDFQTEIGTGTVRDRGDGISELAVVGQNSVVPLLKRLVPYLRGKTKQGNLVLRICEQLNLTNNDPLRFMELARLSDQVSALNDSNNRTITSETVEQTFRDLGLMT